MYSPYRAEPYKAEENYGLYRPSSSVTTSTADTPTISNQRGSSNHRRINRADSDPKHNKNKESNDDSNIPVVRSTDSPKAKSTKRIVPKSIPASALYSHLEAGTTDTIASNIKSNESDRKPAAKPAPPVMMSDSSRTRNVVRVAPSKGLFSHPPMKDYTSSDTESYDTADEERPADLNTTTAGTPAAPERKQGQKCCGCMDFRRAVAITNVIIILLEIVLVILVATGIYGEHIYGVKNKGYGYGGNGPGGEPIFSMVKKESVILDEYKTMEFVIAGVSIFWSIVAIAGAKFYNTIMVGINAVWLLVAYILSIILITMHCDEYCGAMLKHKIPYSCSCGLNIPATLVAGVLMCLFIYPHVGFIVQVHKGILSKESYPDEKSIRAAERNV